jgi:hypothetical protein
MCPEWSEDFGRFISDMGACPPGLTLDRIDVDGPYSPANCRWASRRDQARNKRDTIWVEWRGERVCLSEVAERAGVPYKSLHRRLRINGQPLAEAVAGLLHR